MENASKALLIAAAILVVILLIAFGMSVLNSSGDVGDAATSTGTAIANQTGPAANKAVQSLSGASGWLN